jgi:hypothetical protein
VIETRVYIAYNNPVAIAHKENWRGATFTGAAPLGGQQEDIAEIAPSRWKTLPAVNW